MKIQFVKCPLYHTYGLVLAFDLLWCRIVTTSQFAESTYQTQRTTLCNNLMAITEAKKQAQEVANAKHQISAAAYAQFNVKTREAVGKYICEN